MSKYVPLLKLLRGRPAMMEVGDSRRQSVEVVTGFIWDLFFDDGVTLVIVFKDDNIQKPAEQIKAEGEAYKAAIEAAKAAGQTLAIPAPVPVQVVRSWDFRWVITDNIIAVRTDGQVCINFATRSFTKLPLDPLYSDAPKKHWHVLNNNVSKHIVQKLRELGLESGFEGIYRDEKNETVPLQKAEFTVQVVPNPAPIPPIAMPPAPVNPVAQNPVQQAAIPAAV